VAPASIVPGVTIGDVLDGHVPDCPTPVAWDEAMAHFNLVSPLNRRKFKIIVVGTGLAGSGAAAALGELGYDVQAFTYHDAPRRAHSIAAQGGVNSPRGRKVDNDSLYRFVKDTVKGGDYRCREADAYRLGQELVLSVACRYPVRTTPVAKQDSSFSWLAHRHCSARSTAALLN